MNFFDTDWKTPSKRWRRKNKGAAITRKIVDEAIERYLKDGGTIGTFNNDAGELPRANGADVHDYLLDN